MPNVERTENCVFRLPSGRGTHIHKQLRIRAVFNLGVQETNLFQLKNAVKFFNSGLYPPFESWLGFSPGRYVDPRSLPLSESSEILAGRIRS